MDNSIYIQMGLAIFSTITSAVVVWVGRKFQKRGEAQEAAAKARDEAIQEAERRQRESEAAQNEAICAILRDRMIGIATECIGLGYKQLYMVENMSHMYHSYQQLGGNGAMANLYDQFMRLPLGGSSDEQDNN